VLAVITFGSIWPTLLATVQGFALVEPTLNDVARTLHLSRPAFVWKVGLPSTLPDVFAGMRLSATIALILTIVCEMLAGQEGLGTAILLAARAYQAPTLYAGLVLLGLVGLLTTYLLILAERILLPWQRSGR
jgi:sulfonate transport system permease protein